MRTKRLIRKPTPAVFVACKALILGCSGLAIESHSAVAETCDAQVERLAQEFRLEINPPNVVPGSDEPIGSEELAESHGVLEPGRTDDPSVIEPPDSDQFEMPTTPDIASPPSSQIVPNTNVLSAEEQVILESMLMAARDEALRGQSDGCFERLQEVQEFILEKAG